MNAVSSDIDPAAIEESRRQRALIGQWVRARLQAHPAVEQLVSDGGELYRVPKFLGRTDCREIVRVINSRAVPSTVLGDGVHREIRSSSTHHFDREDPLNCSLEDYVDELLGISKVFSEPMQGQRYHVGQQYRHHHDFFHGADRITSDESARGGQRTWTAMIYLNEPREGGETEFPKFDLRLAPEAGTLVIWNNMRPDGSPNSNTLHAALAVKRGIKHVITKWYRQGPYRLLA
ncbi:hypothetical protein A6F68_01164 [Tsuneonella dongtanensis]|uniref:Fe2OG dioxygenase domain-containing protein n=1 Tax=Tsuneonella dongtanensis TaxID=692370 RepID=A0A1B2ABY9_9SPHN|nr:2OG-Fe(II) oxygenase [Tsuneonella dongtanensis]ANY19682.1 hypothetical protein A6F68_01164 [Tsuneonella dongtanensis]